MRDANDIVLEYNNRFANGEQYLSIDAFSGEVVSDKLTYWWEKREVFNLTKPIIERLEMKYGDKLTDGMLYGEAGVVARLIPTQRAYNTVRNAFLQEVSLNPPLAVEDKSIDVDKLEEEGLAPGKILVYRQGLNAPNMLTKQLDLSALVEEEKMLKEEFREIEEFYYLKFDNLFGLNYK